MKGRAGLAGQVSGYAEQATREGVSPNGAGRLLIRQARPVEEEQFMPTAGRKMPWPTEARGIDQPNPVPIAFDLLGSGTVAAIAVCFSPARSVIARTSRSLSSVTTTASPLARDSAT